MFEPRISGEDATKKCIFVVEVIELEQQLCGMFTINSNLNFPAEKKFLFLLHHKENCHGSRFIKRDDYFQVNFDHF